VARSTKVYVVVDRSNSIVGGFTVKHEMITWMRRYAKSQGYEEGWKCFSVSDGRMQTPFDVKELGTIEDLLDRGG